MKTIRSVFTIIAILTAGVGVFASQFTNFDLVNELRADDPLTATVNNCEILVQTTCEGGPNTCTFTFTTPAVTKNVYRFNSDVNPSTCLIQSRQ